MLCECRESGDMSGDERMKSTKLDLLYRCTRWIVLFAFLAYPWWSSLGLFLPVLLIGVGIALGVVEQLRNQEKEWEEAHRGE